MIIRAVTRVCGFSCLFLERPARAMDPEKESWRTCMKMSPPLESQRPSCVRSVLFISTYAFIHTSKWSHSANVSFCTWNTKTRGFLFCFLGRSLSCDVHACFCAVELFYPQPMWGTRARLWIITGLFCWPETVLQAKTDEFFPIVHGEYLDRIFSPSAATWQEETDLSM